MHLFPHGTPLLHFGAAAALVANAMAATATTIRLRTIPLRWTLHNSRRAAETGDARGQRSASTPVLAYPV
jgi:hypothetical protein